MSASNFSALAPMVNKLAQRSKLGSVETETLLNLPHTLTNISAGTYLVRETLRSESAIVLLAGFAFRSKVASHGARQILSIHLPGDLIDLQNSLMSVADHSIQALTWAEVALIPHQAIFEASEAFPAIAQALWRDTMVDSSIYREWLLNVGQRNARQRIAHLFCELALRQEAAGLCKGPLYKLPMTQEQIGDATGLTGVHVNRTMQHLRSEGLIATSQGSVAVVNWKQLQEAADFDSAYLHLPVAAA